MSPSSTPPQSDGAPGRHHQKQSPRAKAIQLVSSAVAPFLASLFEILSKEDASVIAWCDDGKSFGVYNYDAMEKHILPTYFRHNKFASFQRQLNYFGFRKLHKTKESEHHSIYCQPFFLRHDPARMLQIKRKTHRVKANTPRRAILGSLHDCFSYPYGGCHPASPPSYKAQTPCACPNSHGQDAFCYTSTPASNTPSSSHHTSAQVTSADTYDPLPFYAPSTNVFMSVESPSVCSYLQPVDLHHDPTQPVMHTDDVNLSNVVVYASPGGHHPVAAAAPFPYTFPRDLTKFTQNNLDFLYDDALSI
ncbi:hypothetical protein H310_05525 [Aphanomyces invadans]|nr:hypothetical protein H310_05525 [Aphanomyces invadans]ETW03099.1 hypothetical protein H310_05525 [Aphanomyces invadans]|eukprot:XP_008868483.1 hypothetical protein H310_05525 [Aphanomyces invadans]